jgi:hypothetical protein
MAYILESLVIGDESIMEGAMPDEFGVAIKVDQF